MEDDVEVKTSLRQIIPNFVVVSTAHAESLTQYPTTSAQGEVISWLSKSIIKIFMLQVSF